MAQQKKILVVAESIDIDDSSASKTILALIQNIHAIGYEVTVLHYTRKAVSIPGITCIAIPEIKNSLQYFLSRTQRVLQRIPRLNFSKGLEKRFGHSFTFFNDSDSIRNAVTKHYKDQDVILTLSKGASFRSHHALLNFPLAHKKWLAYIHDPYPFHCYPPPYDWTEAGSEQKEAFFRNVSKKAQYAAFPSLKLKEWMQQFFPHFADKSIIIPHQLREEHIAETPLPNYFSPSKFTVLHAGNLMKQRNPFPLVQAWKNFIAQNPTAHMESQLLLIGPANYHEPKLSNEASGDPTIYRSDGYVPFEIVNKLEASVAVNLILEAESDVSPFLPGKFPHCVSANRPIFHIGPENSESMRLLGPRYPWHAKAGDVFAIENKLNQLYALWKEDEETFQLNRPDLKEYLSPISLKQTLENLL